jgi:hypothetical protein
MIRPADDYDLYEDNKPFSIRKDKVTLRLLNKELIPPWNPNIIIRNIFDMGIYYVTGDENMIREEDIEFNNISEEKLYEIAINKMIKEYDITISPAETENKIANAFLLNIENANECNSAPNNCVSLIYPGILKNFAEKQHSNLYILPLNIEYVYIFTETDIKRKCKAENKSKKEVLIAMEEYLQKQIEDYDNKVEIDILSRYRIPILSYKILYYNRTYNELYALKNGKIDKTAGKYELLPENKQKEVPS